MPIDIRTIHEEELRPWIECVSIGFLDRPNIDAIVDEVRQHWDLSRVYAAVDGDAIVGTTRTWATELTIPGNAQVKASAVTGVSVRPTHRRRGLLRRMLEAEHAAAMDRGERASLLYASEYGIYGRFGYGPATATATWTIDLASTGIHDAAAGRTGSIDFIPADESAIDILRGVYEAWRVTQPGEVWRRPITWKSDLGMTGGGFGDIWKGFLVVHRDDVGSVDGYARYHADPKWEHRQARYGLIVDELQALTFEAQVALWRFLADIDLATTLKAERRHVADRLPWLFANRRAAESVEVGDGLWMKVHDFPGLLEARAYDHSGAVVLEVVGRDDREGAVAEQRVRVALEVSPDGASAAITDRSPELTIESSALGAAFLGGTRLRDAVLAAGFDEHRAGALAEADRLLATLDPPWCATFF
jgi:predicted acetyltransferase